MKLHLYSIPSPYMDTFQLEEGFEGGQTAASFNTPSQLAMLIENGRTNDLKMRHLGSADARALTYRPMSDQSTEGVA